MSKWYSIRQPQAKAGVAAAAEIWIYGDIGLSWYDESVTARDFIRDLEAIDATDITVRINSVGGSVPDGLAMYNAIKRHPANITIAIDGVAMSVASLVAMAGDTVEMADNAILMIHAPWLYAGGNAVELRDLADELDKWAAAMSTSYATKTGKPVEEMLALLTDGKDHYYTADEARAAGFADAVVDAIPIAASASIPKAALDRFTKNRREQTEAAAAAKTSNQEITMADKATTQAATTTQAAPTAAPTVVQAAGPTAAEVLAADKARRADIRAKFTPFAKNEWATDLQRECEDNHDCTPSDAGEKILAKLASAAQPVAGGYVVTIEDEEDKRRESIVAAMLSRAGVADKATREAAKASGYRGAKLLDLARASLDRAGIRHQNMEQRQIVGAAFTQSTSDFPVLLENAMNKTLQAAYATAADTWSRFCAVGSVSDFRDHPRYRSGSLGNLDVVTEMGEYQNKTIPDGEKASISVSTRGNIINLSRQMIINDDLGAFIRLSDMLGRAAKRTIEAAVYALLSENSGLGPTQADGQPLFHSNRSNVGASGAMSVTSIDAARSKMASQTDISGNDFLDLRPAVLLCGTAYGGTARVMNNAEYDPSTASKLQMPNMVRGLYRDVVDTPRITGTMFYSFADPAEAPVIEVAFLDGNQEPFLDLEEAFTSDGAKYKVRLDFGVGVVDYRGAVSSAGA